MLKAGGRLRLAAEPLDEPGILGESLIEQLQRHLAPELLVLGQKHVGHAAGTQARDDPVAVVDHRARRQASHHGPSESRTFSTALATGAATVAP